MKRQVATLLLALSLTGCAAKSATHPGAVNQFDSTSYDTLVTAQAALTQAKAQFASTPAAIPALNDAITAYNTAEAGWQLYHATAGGGITQAQLQTDLANVIAAIASVQKQFSPASLPKGAPSK